MTICRLGRTSLRALELPLSGIRTVTARGRSSPKKNATLKLGWTTSKLGTIPARKVGSRPQTRLLLINIKQIPRHGTLMPTCETIHAIELIRTADAHHLRG